jgi:competence ComEA-like helix-hairpin-helix protein
MKTAYNGGAEKYGPEQNRYESFCFIISILICAVITCSSVMPYLAGPPEQSEITLAGRINPNDASAASLSRLPGMGISRARAIVAYRQCFTERNGDKPAFENRDDLQKIKGIGPKTTQNISEWLKFE